MYNQEEESQLAESCCPHNNTYDDFSTGDTICMDCAHVVDLLLGNNLVSNQQLIPPIGAEEELSQKNRAVWECCENHLHRLHLECGAVSNKCRQFVSLLLRNKRIRSWQTENLAACIIYIILREEGVARTFREIATICGVDINMLSNTYKTLVKFIPEIGSEVLLTPDHYIARFVSYLQPKDLVAASKLEKASNALAQQITTHNILPGRSALTISAAAIYYSGLAAPGCLRDIVWQKRCSEISTVGMSSLASALKLIVRDYSK